MIDADLGKRVRLVKPVFEAKVPTHAAEVTGIVGDEGSVNGDSVGGDEDIAVVEWLLPRAMSNVGVGYGGVGGPIENVCRASEGCNSNPGRMKWWQWFEPK